MAKDNAMIYRGCAINSRAYNVISIIIVLTGVLLTVGGLCILLIGLLR